MLERGEADIIYNVPGELINKVGKLPGVTAGAGALRLVLHRVSRFQDPKNPFRDKRVREAVSLAVDRRAMNQARRPGWASRRANWINDDVLYGIEWPEFPRNVERAKQLLREAGYPNGFDVDWVTPLPTFLLTGRASSSRSSVRSVSAAGSRPWSAASSSSASRAASRSFLGPRSILHGVRIAGSWSFWYEGYFKCGGFSSRDRICVKDLDAKFDQYERSSIPRSGKKSPRRSSAAFSRTTTIVPVFRHAFVNAIGPRLAAQKWQDVFPTVTTGYAYPWEDLKVRSSKPDMPQFIIRRVLYSLVTLFILSATIFLVVRFTGDPVALMAEASARPEDLDRIRRQWDWTARGPCSM